MKFCVSSNAIKELNENGKTAILDKDGNAIGGSVEIEYGQPVIINLFGSDETIYLERLYQKGSGLDCEISTHGCEQFFSFRILKGEEKEYVTEWVASE